VIETMTATTIVVVVVIGIEIKIVTTRSTMTALTAVMRDGSRLPLQIADEIARTLPSGMTSVLPRS